MLDMISLFRSRRRRRQNCSQRRTPAHRQLLENLERRLALAFSVIEHPEAGGQLNWATVLVDEGEDVYVQEVSNSDNDLFIANNASFFPVSPSGTSRVEIPNFANRFNNLSVRSGREKISAGDIVSRVWKTPDQQAQTSSTVSFTVNIPSSQYAFSPADEIVGRLEYKNGEQAVAILFGQSVEGTSGPSLAYETTGGEFPGGFFDISFTSQGDQIRVTLEESADLPIFEVATDIRLTQFDVTDVSRGTPNVYSLAGRPVGVRASEPVAVFSLAELADSAQFRYVPGTLQGQLHIDAIGGLTSSFQIESQATGLQVPLSFGPNRAPAATFVFEDGGIGRDNTISYVVTGEFNTETGQISFRTFLREEDGDGGFGPITLPIRLVDYRVGVRHATDEAATTFTLFDGHVFTTGLTVDLVNPGSSINIESPLVTEGTVGGAGFVSLAATEIKLNAPVRASRQLRVPVATQTDGVWSAVVDGEPTQIDAGTVSERVEINAAVSSAEIELQIADEEETVLWPRSQLVVTQSGSLGGSTNVLAANQTTLAQPAATIFIEVDGGDAFIEGRSFGTSQSIIMRSPAGEEDESPYLLTTSSRLTGAATGSLEGNTVVITLANDSFGPGDDFASYASSTVRLATDVDRLRVQAANREGDVLSQPFDYSLDIVEANELIVDGVAASSGPISITTGGSMTFLAAMETRGDLTIKSGADFTVSAPITTAFGSISLEAATVRVDSQVRVLDAIANEQNRDITIVASDGILTLNDAVAAINTVRLESRSVQSGAGVSGSARIRGDIVDIESEGNVELLTDANLVRVRAPGIVQLRDEGAVGFEIRDSPVVTLVADGFDAYTESGRSPALYADIYDTQTLVVSAANGSIDVVHYGDNNLSIGNRSEIALGQEQVMRAAGSVSIRSNLANEIMTYDAPMANSAAHEVRYATTLSLEGASYTAGRPGLTPTSIIVTLEADAAGRLAALDNAGKTELRVGDDVLVKNGVSGAVGLKANGIYGIAGITFTSNEDVRLILLRRSAFDTAAELDGPLFVRAVEGEVNAGGVFVTEGFDVSDNNRRDIPLVASNVPSRTGFLTAEAIAGRADLRAEFQKNPTQPNEDRIESVANQSIRAPAVRVLFDGVQLFEGNRVVIQTPIQKYGADGLPQPGLEEFAVGVYEVVDEGSDGSGDADNVAPARPWKLKRWAGVDEDGDGTTNFVYESVVAVIGGSRRTAATGEMIALSYSPLNKADLPFRAAEPATERRLDLGTQNPTGTVIYEVSSERGRNDASGSFGKMLTLLQSNKAVVDRTGNPQAVEFQIGNTVQVIELEQALPDILQPITIDPSVNSPDPDRRLFFDGSSIQYLASGRPVQPFGLQQIYAPVPPSRVMTARRLVRGVADDRGIEIHGINLGPETAGSVVRNLTLGGFRQGAAVNIAGGSNILIDELVIGQTIDGARSRNRWGIRVVQGVGGDGGEYTTISNSQIISSSEAGILLDSGSRGVRIVGSTVGRGQQGGNTIGIQVASEAETASSIGVAPVPTEGGDAKYLQGLNPVRGRTELTLGIDPQVIGQEAIQDLYLGQTVSSTEPGFIPAGTTIKKIDTSQPGSITLKLSQPISASKRGEIPLSFGSPAINQVVGNNDGIVVDSGAVRIVNSEVSDSVFDGIILNGNRVKRQVGGLDTTVMEGRLTIGGVVGPEGAETLFNVGVTSNTSHGIRIAEGMWKHLDQDPGPGDDPELFRANNRMEKYNHVMEYLFIEMNRLGTDVTGAGRFSNGEFGDRNIWVDDNASDGVGPEETLRDLFLTNSEPGSSARDGDGEYRAPYRPEDGLDENGDPLPTDPKDPNYIDYLDRIDLDRKGNLHRSGAVGDGTGPGQTPDLPEEELRPGVPY